MLLVSPTIACLEAVYATPDAEARSEASEPTLTIRPVAGLEHDGQDRAHEPHRPGEVYAHNSIPGGVADLGGRQKPVHDAGDVRQPVNSLACRRHDC
jgi:hypothetical protein